MWLSGYVANWSPYPGQLAGIGGFKSVAQIFDDGGSVLPTKSSIRLSSPPQGWAHEPSGGWTQSKVADSYDIQRCDFDIIEGVLSEPAGRNLIGMSTGLVFSAAAAAAAATCSWIFSAVIPVLRPPPQRLAGASAGPAGSGRCSSLFANNCGEDLARANAFESADCLSVDGLLPILARKDMAGVVSVSAAEGAAACSATPVSCALVAMVDFFSSDCNRAADTRLADSRSRRSEMSEARLDL